MKILKLLNNFFLPLFIFYFFFLSFNTYSNEPIDIWELKEEEVKENSSSSLNEKYNTINKTSNLQNQNPDLVILEDNNLNSKNINLVGLYDPAENNLDIDMWLYSDGDQVSAILEKINKLNLSEDSNSILKVALLTNSFPPKDKIEINEFNNFKINYLKKNGDLKLIKKFLIKNNNFNSNETIIQKYLDTNLISGDEEKSCKLFDEVNLNYSDDYIDKFKIYCLIQNDKNEEAQLLYDLKKELNFVDIFFENKFNILMGYADNNLDKFSENSALDFHLSRISNPNFEYIPQQATPKFIWKYLSSYNLLEQTNLIDLEDDEKIKTIEKATHERNYEEKDLMNLYKRFNFTLEQLLSVDKIFKILPKHKARALLYQRLLLTYDIKERLRLAKNIKKLMIEDEIEYAFEIELSNILKEIKFDDVPAEYTTFYNENILNDENLEKKIKFNNKILHQSKLLNYFLKNYDHTRVAKDTNDILKKIKSDKKYIFSNKDKILLDSLEYDGIKIKKQYKNLYDKNSDIPTDLQVLVNNDDIGMLLLRLVEIIGEDNVSDLGTESLYFITTVLNQVDLDQIRNKIIINTLPHRI